MPDVCNAFTIDTSIRETKLMHTLNYRYSYLLVVLKIVGALKMSRVST